MTKRIMERKASDNEYFHRDFHISIDRGIRYVGETFGTEAVEAFLTRFTKNYYAPLVEKVKKEGLPALKEHIENIYQAEKMPQNVTCTISNHSLFVQISACPSVKYMRESGYEPSEWNPLLSTLVYKVIAEEAGFMFSADSYDTETGASVYCFTKKEVSA